MRLAAFPLPLKEGVDKCRTFYSAVIPAQAGIQWLQVLGDPCLRRDDGK
jgi:hypothetical protein